MTQVLITEFCDEFQIQSLICYWQFRLLRREEK